MRYLCTLQAARWPESPLVRLTHAQREVAEAAAAGSTVAEIARHLGISSHTAHDHLKAAYARLGVASRVELAEILARRARR